MAKKSKIPAHGLCVARCRLGQGACVVFTGRRGSSREGEVWALYGFGILPVIASNFGDIFFENSFKDGLLPVVMPKAGLLRLRAAVATDPLATLEVDLEQQAVSVPDGEVFRFEVEAFKRNSLLLGLDDIGVTLQHLGEIESFERHRKQHTPWL